MLELKRKRSFTDDICREVQSEKKLCCGISNEITTISPNISAHENQVTALDLSTRPRESFSQTLPHILENSTDIRMKQTCTGWTTMDVDHADHYSVVSSSVLPRCAKCAAGQGGHISHLLS
ncbi:uncharacterized protein LOC124143876 [Haliotis rufescens]|uniref:uncharacterized protein LOC124143876 n=1 Tax=Haliotis rufescens TaxID=6454 RepID=UPI00201F5DCA|nr:uncharacterized protein LOC124143876 [Haliotis rufescens]